MTDPIKTKTLVYAGPGRIFPQGRTKIINALKLMLNTKFFVAITTTGGESTPPVEAEDMKKDHFGMDPGE